MADGGGGSLGLTRVEITVVHLSERVHRTDGLKLTGGVGRDAQNSD